MEIQMLVKNVTTKTQQEMTAVLPIAKSSQDTPALPIQLVDPQFVLVNIHHQE